jgi:type II secretory pathway pseudopilin PulG
MTQTPALYQEVTNQRGEINGIMRLSDRMFMPLHCGGLDWQAYLDYVISGGLVIGIDVPDDEAQLAQAKQTLLTQVAQAAQAFIDNAVQDAAPRVERDTYPLQAAEAESWALDSNSPTPLLEGIAAARNIDLNELRQRTLDKSRAWQALCASVIGQRQAFEDQIKQATDIDHVTNMVPVFHLPTLG